ncbi:PREDICTED: uncharacterized protein LOC109469955 [Branchiostoma belcheri]|uniref:Uncharacterized protein LOC109469955 n=1 Tax=Branchiostoma belcheri TaxID=7741 RepID=A0A6P4YRE4_BRABE|nr:PREDICTED: uncharacterized protein LOC109469955 [Branchiostoma belcheri]
MVQRRALGLLLLVCSPLLLVLEAAQQCPYSCYTKGGNSCLCPDPKWKGSPCSWLGHGGPYNFPACLDAIATGFPKETTSILIERLTSPTLFEQSFHDLRILVRLVHLSIRKSNVSTIQPGAFRGLQHLTHLYLKDDRISSLEPDTFIGLPKLAVLLLEKNAISTISQHAFRGLPKLQILRLSENRLTSVPVHALQDLYPQPGIILMVDLQMNHIATIDEDVVRLSQAHRLNLMIVNNALRCDKNLTGFVCSLPHHPSYISASDSLKCASPPELRGTNLTALANEICHTDKEVPQQQETKSKPFSEPPMTTTVSRNTELTSPQILYSETIPTEGYTHTGMPQNMPVSENTTQMDYVIVLGGGPLIANPKDVNITAITLAAVVPSLLITVILLIIKFCRGTDLPQQDAPRESDEEATSSRTAEADNIEPYAVAYAADSAEMEEQDRNSTTSGRPAGNKTTEDNYAIQPYAVAYGDSAEPGGQNINSTTSRRPIPPTSNKTTEDNYTIQPYAVAYDDSAEPGGQNINSTTSRRPIPPTSNKTTEDNYKIQPYAVAYAEDNGTIQPYAVAYDDQPGPQLQSHAQASLDEAQPYAVGYPDSPQATRSRAEANLTPQENSSCEETSVKQ